jgi:CIC family chloride channel protein
MGEMMGGILKRITVADALANATEKHFETVTETETLRELLDRFAATKQACFPVVDANQNLVGMVDGRDLRRIIREAGFIDQLIIAKELAVNPPKVTPQEDLYSAVHKMVASQHDELVVVDENDPLKMVGMLSRADLVAAYDRQFLGAAVT